MMATTIEICVKYDDSPYDVIRRMVYHSKEEALADNEGLAEFLANYVK